ncbi:uncharacterized protein LOC127258776 [Andrographis paniculata]|uniref:uncharacterized protein LOC127258776 n=1 Tax=Andrographis paniculata TaxID=175694 RepID=UPI0021E85E08|nr:uncharacterized protein LOC127258776 [Andrographis paniculata]
MVMAQRQIAPPPFFSSVLPVKNHNRNHRSFRFTFRVFYTPQHNNFNLKKSSYSKISSSKEEEGEEAIKVAFARAKAYKDSTQSAPLEIIEEKKKKKTTGGNDDDGDGEGKKDVPLAVKLAMEKAKEYKKNKEEDANGVGAQTFDSASGLEEKIEENLANKLSIKSNSKKGELSVSSIDFVGLGFSDKKTGRGLPPGLVPQSDPFSRGKLPEVEILVGDASKFGDDASNSIPAKQEDVDLYKPKVSTWGVFPRPSDISKTYGGGRTIRPGEALESAEEKVIKEDRTKKLVAAYKSKIGLNIDRKLKLECEKALSDGDTLMDLGRLKEAMPIYEQVMGKLAFQTELHGLAALQWSICQDSLSRPDEARVMYEKLQSHPSPRVSKKARQFFFGFQAMEMMKVSSSTGSSLGTGYQNYFEAFVEEKPNYLLKEAQVDEDGLNQALPYVLFLASPILMVLLIVASKFQ